MGRCVIYLVFWIVEMGDRDAAFPRTPPRQIHHGRIPRSRLLKPRGSSKYDYRSEHGRALADQIFLHFPNWQRGDPVRIWEAFKVPPETTIGWHRHWQRDPDWRPYSPGPRGRRRLFTDEQEAELSHQIQSEFLANGCLFTDMDFRLLAIEAYYRWNPIAAEAETPDFKQFMGSPGFISLFKKRNKFSSRRCHLKRRPTPDPERERRFLQEMAHMIGRTSADHILNCDETSWKLYPNGILTWAKTGSQNVSVNITGNEKDCLTVMATITLAKTKLPLYILAKGETDRCEHSQLGDIGIHHSDHSSSGWMTEETMLRYLDWLHDELAALHGGQGVYELIMDIYPVHVMESVRNHAARLGFTVHFIPSGLTDRYQPLDRAVFGAVKATARSEYLKMMRSSPASRITKADAVTIMQTSWQRLSPPTLEAAWSIFEELDRPRTAGRARTRGKAEALDVCEAVIVEAVLARMTDDQPLVSFRKIVKYAVDRGIARTNEKELTKRLKRSLGELAEKGILRAKGASVRFTSRGLAVARNPQSLAPRRQ